MVDGGWDHHQLNAMDEEEFLFWLEETIDLNRRIAEEQRKAAEQETS